MLLARLGDARVSGDLVEDLLRRHQLPEESSLKKGMVSGFFCNLDILYGGLGIGKLPFLIKKHFNFFSAVIFFQFLVIKALDPDPDWSPASNAGSRSGKNEYRSEMIRILFCKAFL